MFRFALSLALALCFFGCSFIEGSSWSGDHDLYRVRRGDTLSSIGERYGVPWKMLVQANRLSDPNDLSPGMILKVPVIAEEETPRIRALAGAGFDARLQDFVSDEAGELLWPLYHERVSSQFGYRRGRFHEGVDLSAPRGTRIRAVHGGEVVVSGKPLRGYGNIVVIKGNDGMHSVYAHNAKNRVRKGEIVRRGDWIADVGASGKASGNHLHFEIRVPNKQGDLVAVNPFLFYPNAA